LVGTLNKRDDITSKIEEIAERVCGSEGLEVVEVAVLGGGSARVVRIFIDKPEGVTHADCELVSHQVGTILDVEDVVPGGRYHLEVSSPGLDRKLTKAAHFERFLGQKAKIVLREPFENQKSWVGKLARFENNQVTLEPTEGKFVTFPLDRIERANLKFEW
jgi:ribosome maturation factor RimP